MLGPGPPVERFVSDLIDDLGALRNGATRPPVVQRVLRTADVYSGQCLNDLPELVVERSRDFVVRSSMIGGGRVSRTAPIHVVDFAPTFCQLLGVSPPESDGVAIAELVALAL